MFVIKPLALLFTQVSLALRMAKLNYVSMTITDDGVVVVVVVVVVIIINQ